MAEGKRIIVIGGGPGGYVAAIRAAQLGADVTVVEAAELGGACLNHGCIPSKTLLHNVEVMETVRRASEFGIELDGKPAFRLDRILERKRKVVELQVRGIHSIFKAHRVRTIRARGTLVDSRRVRVAGESGEEILPADAIILATGSAPFTPSLFPFDGSKIITSKEALSPESIPGRLLIIGAGVEGSEFAFLYRGMGSEVTLLEIKPRVLHTEDEEVSALIQREMKKRDIRLYTGQKVERVESGDGVVAATLGDGTEITADRVLVSIGRKPATAGLGLEAAGVAVGERGEVPVNERMETNIPGIYAIGDMVGRVMLAHVASMEGKVAAHNAVSAGSGPKTMSYDVIPAGIFTIPEVGTVGLKDWEASERGIRTRVGRFLYRALGRSHTIGEITGMVKVITEAEGGRIVGVHIVGPHASDMVHEAAMAMRFGARAEDVAGMIHAHPTFPEVFMEAAEDVSGEAIHTVKS
jgi:dihydrolipoamide dehydrogenase